MKKIIILCFLLLISGLVWAEDKAENTGNTATAAVAADKTGNTAPAAAAADNAGNTAPAVVQKEKTIIVYDVYRHMETASNIFLGIGGLSIAMGVGLASTANSDNNAIQLGSGIGLALWGGAETGLYLYDKNFGEKDQNAEKARQKFVEMSGWHSIIDLAVMVGGGCLTIFGNNSIKGYGISAMVEGAMLATYDSINFFIASNPKDVKDWGAGVGFNIRLASR